MSWLSNGASKYTGEVYPTLQDFLGDNAPFVQGLIDGYTSRKLPQKETVVS